MGCGFPSEKLFRTVDRYETKRFGTFHRSVFHGCNKNCHSFYPVWGSEKNASCFHVPFLGNTMASLVFVYMFAFGIGPIFQRM